MGEPSKYININIKALPNEPTNYLTFNIYRRGDIQFNNDIKRQNKYNSTPYRTSFHLPCTTKHSATQHHLYHFAFITFANLNAIYFIHSNKDVTRICEKIQGKRAQ